MLKYTVAANEHGVANLEIRIMDDGGTANGGVDTSDSQPLKITINAVNDAPVIGLANGWGIASPDLHATGPYELFGSGVDDLDTRIGDGVESMTMVMEVGLFAEHGTLTLPNAAGVTFLTGDGVDDQLLEFEGELPALNAALSHIEYRPNQFFGGFDRVHGHIDDRGWYGDGGPLEDDDMSILEVKVPLGSASEFDVFGIGDVELLRSSAHGRVAAGEELRLHMFQAAAEPSDRSRTCSCLVARSRPLWGRCTTAALYTAPPRTSTSRSGSTTRLMIPVKIPKSSTSPTPKATWSIAPPLGASRLPRGPSSSRMTSFTSRARAAS